MYEFTEYPREREDAAKSVKQAATLVNNAVDFLKPTKKQDGDHYYGYAVDDLLYRIRRLASDLHQLVEEIEAGPDVDDDGNELEPIERARDARHDESYGPRD